MLLAMPLGGVVDQGVLVGVQVLDLAVHHPRLVLFCSDPECPGLYKGLLSFYFLPLPFPDVVLSTIKFVARV